MGRVIVSSDGPKKVLLATVNKADKSSVNISGNACYLDVTHAIVKTGH